MIPMLRFMRAFVYCVVLVSLSSSLFSQKRDTTWVQTFTFDSIYTREATFKFPPKGEKYEKVLMWYTLKCDPKTPWDKYNCGEWDYLTYTGIRDSSARFDSTRLTHPNFKLSNGNSPALFKYTSKNVPSYAQRAIVTAKPISLNALTAFKSSGSTNKEISFKPGARIRFVCEKSKLTSMGLTAGKIDAFSLVLGTGVDWAKISGKPLFVGQAKQLHQDVTRSFPSNRVSYIPVLPKTDSVQSFVAENSSLVWDGKSALIFDFELSQASDVSVFSVSSYATTNTSITGFGTGAVTNNKALLFTRGDYVSVPPAALTSLKDEVTVAFWHYGAKDQPQNNNTFEARGADGERILNAHVPWGDKTVYWDAGNNTGYDRIQKAANDVDIKMQWNHWAFTKNSKTGTMKIFLNGELWHSGTDKKRSLGTITDFKIGSGVDGSFSGMLDEFTIFNRELSSEEVLAVMQYPITSQSLGVIARYSFDKMTTDSVYTGYNNGSPLYVKGTLIGMPQIVDAEKTGLVFSDMLDAVTVASPDVQKTAPQVIAYRGTLSGIQKQETLVTDTIPAKRITIFKYDNPANGRIIKEGSPNYPTTSTDTLTVYAADVYSYKFDVNSKKTDSTYIPAENEIAKVEKVWYSPIVNYELWRYITPYGIGLDLGPKGFRWVFDVTDYEPLLHDWVRLYAGNTQELLDLKFLFIKGTPPRDVIAINNLWNGDRSHGEIADDKAFTALDFKLNPDAKNYRVKIRVSGHGFGDNQNTNCAEFCPKNHYVKVKDKTFQWLLWNECATNPVYPQGGTWTLDRAGWCPGAEVPTQDFELTPFVSPGETVSMDYGMEKYDSRGAFGNYVVRSQLISYGAPNYATDASIEDIIQPNDWEFYSRMNPICNQPKIVIKNKGTTELTSLSIEYGVKGGAKSTYEWKGNLKFLQTDTLLLPSISWGNLQGKQRFEVTVKNPNGGSDQNELNNFGDTRFDAPPILYSDLEINLKTNRQAASQYEWYLKKSTGEIIGEGSSLEDEQLYKYNYTLAKGCYEFRLTNREDYGLDLWFVREQLGSGYLRLLSNGKGIRTFNPDFGRDIFLQFVVADKPTIKAVTQVETLDFGNPAINEKKELTFKITPQNETGLVVNAVNVSSLRKFYSIASVTPEIKDNGTALAFGDTMTIVVAFSGDRNGKHTGTLSIESNDELSPTFTIPMTATIGTTSAEDQQISHDDLILDIVPNPNDGNATITYGNANGIPANISVIITDLLGNQIRVLDTKEVAGKTENLMLPNDLPNGTYNIVLKTSGSTLVKQFIILK